VEKLRSQYNRGKEELNMSLQLQIPVYFALLQDGFQYPEGR